MSIKPVEFLTEQVDTFDRHSRKYSQICDQSDLRGYFIRDNKHISEYSSIINSNLNCKDNQINLSGSSSYKFDYEKLSVSSDMKHGELKKKMKKKYKCRYYEIKKKIVKNNFEGNSKYIMDAIRKYTAVRNPIYKKHLNQS